MSAFSRKILFSTTLALVALAVNTSPAFATTHHHHKHHAVTSSATIVRIAQQHLTNLGYYAGKIDGKMGPQTRAAIKKFQHDQGLKADGVLGKKTNAALAAADHRVIGTHSIPMREVFSTHDAATSADQSVNSDYATSLNGGSKPISTRFARLDVSESGTGADKRYNVNLNGTPVLTADGQPSIIGISPTYDLGGEDAVVFTTYSPNDSGCIYRSHVLAMDNTNTKMLDIENCTRNYQARVENSSLYISFPEQDDNRAFASVWRLEGMDLTRL